MHYSEAWEELNEFATAFGIPVGETHAGRGALRDGSANPLSLSGTGLNGTPSAAEIAAEADLVLCIGTRLHDFITGSSSAFHDPNVRFVSVNVNGRDAYKLGALPITADAKLALQALTEAGRAAGVTANSEWVAKANALAGEWETTKREQIYVDRPGEELTQAQVIGVLNEQMQEGDVLVCAAGTVPSDITKLFDAAGGARTASRVRQLVHGLRHPRRDRRAARTARRRGVRAARRRQLPDASDGARDGDPGAHQAHRARQRQLRLPVDPRPPAVVCRPLTRQRVQGPRYAPAARSTRASTSRSTTSRTPRASASQASPRARRARYVTRSRQPRSRRLHADRLYVDKSYAPPGSGVWWEVIGAEVTGDETTRAVVEEREAGRVNQRFHY